MATLTEASLTDVERRTLGRLVELLKAELGTELRAVWLFGSRARGEPRGTSRTWT
ncbi:MAG: nucleotidyltransferase domain-containing protein [Solirubrobacterales bacterium]